MRRRARMWFGLAPLAWLVAWAFYSWARREVRPTHPDVGKILGRRAHYRDLLDGHGRRGPSR